jgi:hypothetical protein
MVINGKKESKEVIFWQQMNIFKPVLPVEEIRQVNRQSQLFGKICTSDSW